MALFNEEGKIVNAISGNYHRNDIEDLSREGYVEIDKDEAIDFLRDEDIPKELTIKERECLIAQQGYNPLTMEPVSYEDSVLHEPLINGSRNRENPLERYNRND